jgi:hypothetical protein
MTTTTQKQDTPLLFSRGVVEVWEICVRPSGDDDDEDDDEDDDDDDEDEGEGRTIGTTKTAPTTTGGRRRRRRQRRRRLPSKLHGLGDVGRG